MQGLPKIVIALFVQLVAFGLLALLVFLMPLFFAPPYSDWMWVLIQGLMAAGLSARFGLPSWWQWIQFLLPVGLYLGLLNGFDPIWALGLFILVWLVFANSFKERVPLYLTNNTTRQALKELVKKKRAVNFLDMGCGLGGNVAFMSHLKGVQASHGVETAPIPFILSKLVTFFRGGQTFAMDMWKTDLAYYDVVYAFLSPEPMPKLWLKVVEEMPAGSVFVSNSFAVPDVEPTEVWQLSDTRQTILYIYKL